MQNTELNELYSRFVVVFKFHFQARQISGTHFTLIALIDGLESWIKSSGSLLPSVLSFSRRKLSSPSLQSFSAPFQLIMTVHFNSFIHLVASSRGFQAETADCALTCCDYDVPTSITFDFNTHLSSLTVRVRVRSLSMRTVVCVVFTFYFISIRLMEYATHRTAHTTFTHSLPLLPRRYAVDSISTLIVWMFIHSIHSRDITSLCWKRSVKVV